MAIRITALVASILLFIDTIVTTIRIIQWQGPLGTLLFLLTSFSMIVFLFTVFLKYDSSSSNIETGISDKKESDGISNNEGAGGIKWLCFFIPLVGLILYLMWKDEKPVAAKECGKFALIGVVIGIVIAIIGNIILYSVMMSSFNY